MSLSILTNTTAMQTEIGLNKSSNAVSQAMQRLSSGLRINSALQYTSNAISVTQENMSSSLSNIQDVNMATEMTTITQQQVLQQAGTAMLAQANSQPQVVLKLITG